MLAVSISPFLSWITKRYASKGTSVSTLIAHYKEKAKKQEKASLKGDHKTSTPEGDTKRFMETYNPKETDFDFELTKPSQVIYGHLEATKNRLNLFQMMNLKDQLDVDKMSLRSFSKFTFTLPSILFDPTKSFKLFMHGKEIDNVLGTFIEEHFKFLIESNGDHFLRFLSLSSVIGGLKDYIEPRDAFLAVTFHPQHLVWTVPQSFIPSDVLPNKYILQYASDAPEDDTTAPFISFQLSGSALHKFRLLCGDKVSSTGEVLIMGDKFPFIELNRQYLLDVLLALLKECLTCPDEMSNLPLNFKPPTKA